MEEQKEFKEEKPLENIKEVEMGIFGRGKGFLGISVRYNWLISLISTILGILGIVYFLSIKQPLSALGVFGVWILIQIETYR